jgi:hypothetical protein
MELLFEPRCAIAIAARPGFRPILIAALAPIMRILHAHQVEIFFPIRTLFQQRYRTVANLDPPRRLVWAKPRIIHVAQVFALRDGALSESFILDGLQQIVFATGFNAGSNKITHNSPRNV